MKPARANEQKKSKNIIFLFINLITTIMKKSLFFVAAASALMLTACSSDSDVLQSAAQLQQSEPKAVGFDVYTQNATEVTRAGYEGVMNTTRLQGVANGFGIFGYYSDQSTAVANPYPTSGYVPNFMYNEHVTWNNINKGWVYTPLKYWPNETENDSQTNPDHAVMNGTLSLLDKLTFFAYAPYVSAGAGSAGIRAITANDGTLTTIGSGAGARSAADPAIEYKTAATATESVDLLWGVAPAGGHHYTGVNGNTYGANQGLPYLNLVKPDVNTSLKFYFQHALARFGFTVAAAIDQVPQGGVWPGDNATRITVEKIELTGYFANEGILNLNNPTAGVANWINMCGNDLAQASVLGTAPLDKRTIEITTDIAENIKDQGDQVQTIEGVTTAKKELIQANYTQVDDPTTFVSGEKYYDNSGNQLYADITGNYYILVASTYKKVTNSQGFENSPTYFSITEGAAVTSDPGATHDAVYEKSGNDYTLAYAANADMSGADFSKSFCYLTTITDATASVTEASFTWPDVDYYKPERSYFMVVPTNNVPYICTDNFGTGHDANNEALRTVWVTITYYVTTEDTKLSGGKSRVKNVIQKKVVLPSLDNGKSYNLHLLLGLTSVKVEAEVADWDENYVQTDLPQNTPGE